ncbi:spore germination protein [uncultured Rummeliibacillus sp.]|uniref:spore germination protein n=1 Tax=uncultured Rummeliibacillus sp. TaxID=762292 RepID=UPI00262320DE|nr:spore germination protein [uncultured Rummeliibacillus sp.]
MSNSSFEKSYLEKSLEDNIQTIKKILGSPADLIIRKSSIGIIEHKFAMIYMKGLVNEEQVNNNILRILELNKKDIQGNLFNTVYEEMIALTEIKKSQKLDQVIKTLLSGDTVVLLDNCDLAIQLGTSGGEFRAIEEPQSEAVIRGSRSGFVENLKFNLALLRREIKDPNLRINMMEVGKHSNQKVAICHIEGQVKQEIVDEVVQRLKTINVDFAPDSGFIEQWIEDSNLSPFPQILDTERPDRVAYNLLKGKVSIIVEGSPFALLMPITIGDSLKTIEDYNQRWLISTLLRFLRFVSFYMTLFLPALYVALVSYHPELIPTQLLFTIAASREGVPFPSLVEALLIALFYEILQEAGTRLPRKIGQTIGIVGGIVIGEIAVQAGIVTPLMVIAISLTAISAFTLPNYSLSIGLRVIRFGAIFAATLLGLYGIILVFIMIHIHLANLKSIGIPYSAPFAPNHLWDLKNVVIRAPITTLTKRQPQPFLEPMKSKQKTNGGKGKS